MESRLGCFDLSSFVCPITNAILDEPMLAEDGRTYSKNAILAWFKSRSDRQLPITSPCTRKPISESLVPNADIAKSIEEYRKGRQGERSASGKAAPAIDATLAPKSLAELGAMFSLLDGLRQLLVETLDGWHPPLIVVVGQESSGKSSVLERLMMTPLLPRDENICTRLPIHVRLRRSDKAMPPRLEVYNTLTKTTEKGPYVISAQYGDFDVSEGMRRILTEEQGSLRGVSSNRIIILHVTNPDVPFLDLVDMPGIVTVPSGNEPSDMATQTSALVKNHIQSEYGANSLYLAVVKASNAPNVSVALQILHEANLCEKTFGVFTFSDDLGRKHARKLEQWVRNPSDRQGAVELESWDWVATTNAPPEDEQGNAVAYENNCARLRAQAAAEVTTFRDMQLGQLVDDNLASHGALVSRLNRMFLDYLKNTWAPRTLPMLSSEQSKLAYDNALLGMPPAHEHDTPPPVKEAIAQEVEMVLDSGATTLMQQYATSVLTTLQRQIEGVVHKAIRDAFPAAWLQSHQYTPSVILSPQQDWQIRGWLADPSGAPDKHTLKLELLYRASRDGWRTTDFHSECDNQGATVTVVKSTGGHVFGGYADLPWASSGQWLPSTNAFIFALQYPSGVAPVKMPLTQAPHSNAMYDHSSYGPTFGSGHDIYVAHNANSNSTSSTSVGVSYQLPAGQNAQTFHTGALNFQAAEIEVFRVVFDAPQVLPHLLVPVGNYCEIFEQPGQQEDMGTKIASSVCSMENLQITGGIVKGGGGRRKEDYGRVPHTYGPIMDLCKRTLDAEEEEEEDHDDVPNDTSFWVEGVRALFPADLEEQSPWPSLAAQQLVDKPPCKLAKRFPGLIDSLVEEIKGDLKSKADSLILDAVTRRVRLFSDEVACVEGWRKKFTPKAVEISVIEAGSVSELTNDIVLIFLRYKGGMLQELQASVRDRLVGRVSLRETCAEQRLEIISKEGALHRAKEGIFQLLGLNTQEERQEWEERSKMTPSVILSRLQADMILGWLGKQKNLELLYRASRDGWRVTDFHSECDNQGATVTVIKSTGGYVFGGYADLPWSSSGQWLPSSNAFLFALQYPSGVAPVKMPLTQAPHPQAMYDHSSYGPTFGFGHAIHVADNSNSNSNSYNNAGHAYQLPAGQNAQTFFTSARNFQAAEIEVFRVTS